MDILISSNLERLLYYKSGKDADYIHELMKSLEEKGSYQVRSDIFKDIQKDFYGGYCDDETCAAIMKEFYEEKGYVLDPHTAVGYKVMKDYQKMMRHLVSYWQRPVRINLLRQWKTLFSNRAMRMNLLVWKNYSEKAVPVFRILYCCCKGQKFVMRM